MEERTCCSSQHPEQCLLCGKPLTYFTQQRQMECAVCHRKLPADAACESGHFVCDDCHRGGGAELLGLMGRSRERDPIALYLAACALEGVHLHGPEHHCIVPCALLTAFRNCGGAIDLEKSLAEAWRRGQKISGGSCGFLGVCGAAAGAGIFASIVIGATPLKEKEWAIPQRLTARCLDAIAAVGGPRCCKRTGRIAIETAAAFAETELGVKMPLSRPPCTYCGRNRECIRDRCPFFPGKE